MTYSTPTTINIFTIKNNPLSYRKDTHWQSPLQMILLYRSKNAYIIVLSTEVLTNSLYIRTFNAQSDTPTFLSNDNSVLVCTVAGSQTHVSSSAYALVDCYMIMARHGVVTSLSYGNGKGFTSCYPCIQGLHYILALHVYAIVYECVAEWLRCWKGRSSDVVVMW